MSNEIILTIAGAAATGLAAMAFKYPKVYKKTLVPMALMYLAVFLLLALWAIAIVVAFDAATPFIDPVKLPAARLAVSAYQVDMKLMFFATLIFMVYLAVLDWFAGQVIETEIKTTKE